VTTSIEQQIREICLSLPEATERASHDAPAFFATKQFLILWRDGHHDHEFAHLWCAAPAGVQPALIESNPDRFFYPPYVGHRGWIGVRLDGELDLEEIETLCVEAYRCVATKRQLALLDNTP
jgi:hypothetical protein